MDYSEIDRVARSEHPKTDGSGEIQSDRLDHVMYRMGMLAALRSKVKKAAIGVMITASHNEEPDNGIKLVDPAGEMLEASWEKIATRLANVSDSDLAKTYRRIIEDEKIDAAAEATVIVGRDTRRSSESLSVAAVRGANVAGAKTLNYEIVTTPQLHYLVASTNENSSRAELGEYYERLCEAFGRARSTHAATNNGNYTSELALDCANGVGAIAAKEFQERLKNLLAVEIFNAGEGPLNRNCGADYVKVHQVPPSNVPTRTNARCVSIDGDADRIVYYYIDENSKFNLLDGDRIATLVAVYLKELIETSGLTIQLGLVQTAYANGASTDYITNVLKVPVACVPTGVKHLHHRALEFDIGVYFEANGHGTVVFKRNIVERIREASNDSGASKHRREAATRLANLVDVINQYVGDALSDMLLVETILSAKGWDLKTWQRCYEDFPNRQLKLRVPDRNLITTTDAERKCVTPAGLQEKIDELIAIYPNGRAFVRPSGTEDVVRIYAECKNAEDVEKLAEQVSREVQRFVNRQPANSS